MRSVLVLAVLLFGGCGGSQSDPEPYTADNCNAALDAFSEHVSCAATQYDDAVAQCTLATGEASPLGMCCRGDTQVQPGAGGICTQDLPECENVLAACRQFMQ